MLAVFSQPRQELTDEQKKDDSLRAEALAKSSLALWKFKADLGGAKSKAAEQLAERLSALSKTMVDELAGSLSEAEISEAGSGIR